MAKNDSKITAQNTFEGGLVADLHEMASPPNTVRDAVNMELVTVGNDQYVYQNIRGNAWTGKIGPDYSFEGKNYPFIPLGVKVHNDIAYILAGAFKDEEFLIGMIGTFPSPDWDLLNTVGTAPIENVFRPLHNYKPSGETEYTFPFVSQQFQFEKNRHIDIEIQGDFDSSVNIIFTDDLNKPSIINSRFSKDTSGTTASLADRQGATESNVYSDSDWDRVTLVQNSNFPITVSSMEVEEGGYLLGGGYRYFFKYTTQEGNTTEVLYESPLIPISNGNLGLSKDQISNKKTVFILRDLDDSYSGIKVYFAHIDGETTATYDIFEISAPYVYETDAEELSITHTGLEAVEAVDISEISSSFTPIDTVKTSAIINDRLALAGATSTLSEESLEALEAAALRVTLWEKSKVVSKDYSDPNTASKELGYWKGEVYEFGIVFMLTNKGLSPVFPVTGMDNINDAQGNVLFEYPANVNYDENGFGDDANMTNQRGIFRTANAGIIFQPTATGVGKRYVTYIEADTSDLIADSNLDKIASGFFIVRRERIKNVLMQGMMTPALKLPAKPPTISDFVKDAQVTLVCSKRYLGLHYPEYNPTLGLNATYRAIPNSGDSYNDTFNADFDTVFVPQPTQMLNVTTFDKTWIVTGSVGQVISSINYGRTVDREGIREDKMHLTFLGAELDMNYANIQESLNGVNPSIEIQNARFVAGEGYLSQVAGTNIKPNNINTNVFNYEDPSTPIVRIAQAVFISDSSNANTAREWITIPSTNTTATLLESGRKVYSRGAFSANIDRSFGLISNDYLTTGSDLNVKIQGIPYKPFVDSTRVYGGYNTIASTSKSPWTGLPKSVSLASDFEPYSLVTQSYSSFLGIKIDTKKQDGSGDDINLPTFAFDRYVVDSLSNFSITATGEQIITHPGFETYVNTGHLANIFRSSTGRWDQLTLRTIYKIDSNAPYFSVTDRQDINKEDIPIFSGDCFISRIFKRITYKNGVPEVKSATSADAGVYGVGITRTRGDSLKNEDLNPDEKDDKGRGLFDTGQIIEIAAQCNINADIRSEQVLSDDEEALYGDKRSFYPHKEEIFSDSRPDTGGYNHGYTGDVHLLTYNRIEANAPTYNVSFPNRVFLSERNQTQSFFNSFRDLKGFNFRDYGVELGPIIKVMPIKNILLTIHPGGVLAIGVDDKTLLAEGSDVYINTAEALSPTAKTISDVYGSINPESITKTDVTVAGVDYSASAVWLFEGNKLSIISEFAVKTILEGFKAQITGIPRVYTSFNFTKHLLTISYVSENPISKEQENIGSITYNTALQKWSSRLSKDDGIKFSMSIGYPTYTTGFSTVTNLYGLSDIWEEDALIVDGQEIRNKFRGNQREYEFEFIINMQPSVEKVLDNILAITNKVLPDEIEYITSGDFSDATENAFPNGLFESNGERKVVQKIVTRNNSTRTGRLGILEENAYYKNSNLYIEVNKRDSVSRRSKSNQRIRDKHIKVRFKYTGSNPTFLQAIISMLSISYS